MDANALKLQDDTGELGQAHCFAAMQYEAAGNKQKAIAHYTEAAKSLHRNNIITILACRRLRALGEDPLALVPHYIGLDKPNPKQTNAANEM